MENSSVTRSSNMAAKCRKTQEKRILIVGLVCLDIINTVDRFPEEDEDMRALSQHWQKGGNAANTAVLLSQTLACTCELLCCLNQSFESQYVKKELQNRGVLIDNCPVKEHCGFPTSCVLLNCESGTRTIVHSRNNLPELSTEDFDKLDFGSYDWIHFEGRRNVDGIIKMINKIQAFIPKITVSVELEKKREDLRKLLGLADVVFVGKDFAQFYRCNSAEQAINEFKEHVKPATILVCPWGEQGAFAIAPDGKLVSSPAFPPPKVMDTLGAGDTFNAGVIFSLRQGKTLEESLEFGCKLAGRKCGLQGFDGLSMADI